jgi:hypothetical protein
VPAAPPRPAGAGEAPVRADRPGGLEGVVWSAAPPPGGAPRQAGLEESYAAFLVRHGARPGPEDGA